MKLNFVRSLGFITIRLDAVDKPRHVGVVRLILWGSLRDKPREVGLVTIIRGDTSVLRFAHPTEIFSESVFPGEWIQAGCFHIIGD